MAVSKRTLYGVVIQLALALFLVVSGILTLQLNGGFIGKLEAGLRSNEIASAVRSFLKGDSANIVIIILGVCELIAGIFLLINLFIDTGRLTNIFVIVILIVWLIVIVLVDILGAGGLLNGAFKNTGTILAFFKGLSSHLLVLGALMLVWKR